MGDLQALRGTRDILPDEIGYWQWVEATTRDILTKAAYREIRTPIFEQTALFERGIGEATDVVGKEMYTFHDRGDRWGDEHVRHEEREVLDAETLGLVHRHRVGRRGRLKPDTEEHDLAVRVLPSQLQRVQRGVDDADVAALALDAEQVT